jgi:hypothetical protein
MPSSEPDAGGAAFLLAPYVPPRERRLRLPDIYEMFEAMKDHAYVRSLRLGYA